MTDLLPLVRLEQARVYKVTSCWVKNWPWKQEGGKCRDYRNPGNCFFAYLQEFFFLLRECFKAFELQPNCVLPAFKEKQLSWPSPLLYY